MNVVIALWSAVNYFSLYPGFGIEQIIWIRLVLFCAVPLTYLFFLLIHTFPSERFHLKPAVFNITLGWTILIMLCTLSPYVFERMVTDHGATTPVPGILMPLFALSVTGYIAAGIYILVRKYSAAHRKLRIQMQYLLYGTTVMFALILSTVLFPSVFLHNSSLAPYASLYTFIFAGATAYAIVKHKLFNIQAVVARSVAYTLLLSIVLIIYTSVIFGLSQILHQQHIGIYQLLIYTLLAMFVAITFQPLKKWLENKTDQIFFKDRYSTSSFLAELSKIITSTLDLERLSQSALSEVMQTIHIQKGAIFVETKEGYKLLAHQNFIEMENIDQELLEELFALQEIFNTENEDSSRLLSSLLKKNIAIVAPFTTDHTMQGLLVLGDKKSGDTYTSQDLQLLGIIGPELSVAIENAHSYQQISQFNQVLQHEIDKATKQLREANEQLSRKNHQLEQLDKLKDEFISVTSHELRTPLTAIRGYLWMIINGKKDDSFKLYLDRAYISSERLINLVNDTLDISRIESGRVQLDPTPTKLPALAKQVAEELEPKAKERQQKLSVKQASHLPAVMCDGDKIHQVLTNLVGNALKFTPESGSISIHFYVDNKHVVTAITDTGPGISQEDQKKLFQKFSRVGNTGDVPGTGLGLYLCQQIVSLSKGKIWVDSIEGKGATFFFSLPVSHVQPSILAQPSQRNFKRPATT